MPQRGRPPKPTEEKRRLGNPGGRALTPAGAELAVVPPLPATLADQTPAEALEKVMQRGVHWLAETDGPAVALLRELLEERGELKAAIDAGVGDRKALRDVDKQAIALLAQLGFDPASRSRLGLAEVKAASKLEGIRASQAKRMAPKVADKNHAG
jgi:hypothetical protein